MASEHSFDISAAVDMMEVKNALETAKKEIAARYDFKGLAAEVELNEKEKIITLLSSSDNKIDALKDIVISKLIKRNIPPVAVTESKRESASGANIKATLKLNDTLDSENAKFDRRTRVKFDERGRDFDELRTRRHRGRERRSPCYRRAKFAICRRRAGDRAYARGSSAAKYQKQGKFDTHSARGLGEF